MKKYSYPTWQLVLLSADLLMAGSDENELLHDDLSSIFGLS